MTPRSRVIDNLDTISTVAWLAMDICWMEGHLFTARIFAALAAFPMVAAIKTSIRQDEKNILPFCAALCWLLMNASWMISEQNKDFLVVREVFMWLAIGLTTSMFVLNKNAMSLFRRFGIRGK